MRNYDTHDDDEHNDNRNHTRGMKETQNKTRKTNKIGV